jgi:glycosyltransferase involved in cell wall biosynthesis
MPLLLDPNPRPKALSIRTRLPAAPDGGAASAAMEGVTEAMPATSTPLVSICVTAHNYARFLPACIDSILQQSYQPIECIVVDDGSTDDTEKVLAGYGDRIQVVRHQAASGQLAAIVSAFERSQGQFISFVDADDLLYRDNVTVNIAAHTAAETYAAVATSYQQVVDAEGHVLATHPPLLLRPLFRLPKGSFRHYVIETSPTAPIPVMIYDPQANYAHQWLWGTMSSMMFRRDAVSLVLSENLSGFSICADAYLAQFCHALGGTVMIERPLGAYRRHGANNYATNLVIGGFSPLSGRRDHDENPRPLIAAQISARQDELRRALGVRRFVALVEKFCPLPQAWAILRDRKNPVGLPMLAWFLALWGVRHLRLAAFRARRVFGALRMSETP